MRVKARVSNNIIGESANIVYVKQSVEKIAPLNGRCVIVGPTGSDKEIIAKEIHRLSTRADGYFGVLNCQAYSAKQLEVELFGVQINAENEPKIKPGIIEKTSDGTLFLDEIHALAPDLQLKLLKALKEESFCRVGSNVKIPFNVRLIAGVCSDIDQLLSSKSFSDELFCRLNANIIKLAPLSDRREDISHLLDYFMEQSAKAYHIAPRRFSNEALGILYAYQWPGDAMQLRNLVDWVLVNNMFQDSASVISIEELPKEIMEGKTTGGGNSLQFFASISELSIKEAREAFEKEYFTEQLKKFDGNISKTSKFVGMERSALHRKLKSLNITDSKNIKEEI